MKKGEDWLIKEFEIYLDFRLAVECIFEEYYEKFEDFLDDRRIDIILAMIRKKLKEEDIA